MIVAGYDNRIANSQQQKPAFEKVYLNVRQHEQRMISDDELTHLPDIDPSHIHSKEWHVRKRSMQKLVAYLQKKKKLLNILEIGCGNGWLASKLADIPGSKVIGLDINREEIKQAKRVFKKNNLEFTSNCFKPDMFIGEKFDIILFAASIPYFGNLKSIISDALSCLSETGEIHIVDTHFYKQEDIDNAVNRMEKYYEEMGYPEMSGHYYHHSLKDMELFNYKLLTDPQSLFNRISKKEPFYWVVINH